jgi:thiamine biosynthesis lipoprotein
MDRYQHSHYALGSDILLTIVTDKGENYASNLFDTMKSQIAAFEQQFSRFLPNSELTYFNQRAGHKINLSPSFIALLKTVKRFTGQTDGIYNPFVLPLLQRAGYVGSWPSPHKVDPATNFSDRLFFSVDGLKIGKTWGQIPPKSALDFGGIGKGYLLDELANRLKKERPQGYWLSIGGDIVCEGTDLKSEPWRVAVASALNPKASVGIVANTDGERLGIATSGITKRRGLKDGKPWNHLIDPRSGLPVKNALLTATVSASQAVIADVYAKCIMIAGDITARRYEQEGWIKSFIVQTHDQTDILETQKDT